MKKIITFLMAICLISFFASCDPQPQPGPTPGEDTPTDTVPTLTLASFIGEYDLQIDQYESYIDNELSEDDPAHFTGLLSISYPEGVENPQFVNVSGKFNLGSSGNLYEIYKTTGSLNADGDLVLEDNIYSAAVDINISYKPIKANQPLTWLSTMSYSISGSTVRYELNNIATLKENK